MPRHGVGARLQKNTWKEDSYWDVVKVQVDLTGADGKSYGLLTWRGVRVHEEPRRIPGTRKKVWRVASSGEEAGPDAGGRRFAPLDAALIDTLSAGNGAAAGGERGAVAGGERGAEAEAVGGEQTR